MTKEEKIAYMRIAASICNYGFSNEQLDLLVSLYELILEEKNLVNIETIFRIEQEVKNRSDIKHRESLLDKVSEKVK